MCVIMAPVNRVGSESSDENPCKVCSRPTKSVIKCTKCGSMYHAACAVRVRGLHVVGFNELLCPSCSENAGETDTETDSGHRQCVNRLVETNVTLNSVVLRLMVDWDDMKSEIGDLKLKIAELTKDSQLISRQAKAF